MTVQLTWPACESDADKCCVHAVVPQRGPCNRLLACCSCDNGSHADAAPPLPQFHRTVHGRHHLLADHLADIQDARNFAALHALLKKLLASRAGLGELYLYDTALRIGAKLGVLPQAIYLHAGTRAGAKALKLSVTGNIVLKSELPV